MTKGESVKFVPKPEKATKVELKRREQQLTETARHLKEVEREEFELFEEQQQTATSSGRNKGTGNVSLDQNPIQKIQIVSKLTRHGELETLPPVTNLDLAPDFNFSDGNKWPKVTNCRKASKLVATEKMEITPKVRNNAISTIFSTIQGKIMCPAKVEDHPRHYLSEERVDDEWNLVSQKRLYKDVLKENPLRSQELDIIESEAEDAEESNHGDNVSQKVGIFSSMRSKLWL